MRSTSTTCALVSLLTASTFAAAEPLAIKGGTVLTMAGPPIQNAWVLIEDGKIVAVGDRVNVPEDVTVIDATGKVVMPGLVAALTTLAEGAAASEWTMSPEVRAIDGFDTFQDRRKLLAGGVTCAYVTTSRRRLISGQGAVVKLGGPEGPARIVRDTAALRITLGALPKNPPGIFTPPIPPGPDNPVLPEVKQLPGSRLSQPELVRRFFAETRAVPAAERDLRQAALTPYLEKRLPVRINCGTAGDIRTAIRLVQELGVSAILEAVTEGHQMVEEIAASKLPVVLNAVVRPGSRHKSDDVVDVVTGKRDPRTPGLLARAGVPVALCARTTNTTPDLLAMAAASVGYGMPAEAALRAITADAAAILGVADRVGSLVPGRDADLLILSGDPLATATQVEETYIAGVRVHQAASPADDADAGKPTVVLASEIWTGSGRRLTHGMIVCRDGKIDYVGPRTDPLPAEADVHELADGVIAPGFLDVHSHVGLHWESEPARVLPPEATTGPDEVLRRLSPALAVVPTDPAFGDALLGGVTTALLSPRDAGLFCGNVAAVKMAAPVRSDSWIIADRAACKFSVVGGGAKFRRGNDVRDLLAKARDYLRAEERHDRELADFDHRKLTDRDDELDKPTPPGRDPERESMAALFDRRIPAFVRADRADEIRLAIEVFREEFGLDLVILGGSDARRVVDELRRFDVPVVIGPDVLTEEKGEAINNAALLARAGVRVAFQSDATTGTRDLRLAAAYAVRHGMDEADALRALTAWPAEILKLDDRVGELAPGRDADLVVFSGSPLEFTSSVQRVMVDGEWVYGAP